MRSFLLFSKNLLLPPLNLFVLGALGWILSQRWRRLGYSLMSAAVLLMFLLSTPYISSALMQSLQPYPALPLTLSDADVDAIVILGGDLGAYAPEYGGHSVGAWTLERLQYGSRLYRKSRLPILVTGGRPYKTAVSLAEIMRDTLISDFQTPVRWMETSSHNTYENAIFSARLLKAVGMHKIYLVTHAWHMPRALASFQATDIEVIPAPTRFVDPAKPEWMDFLPTSRALIVSYLALHERLGNLWYDFYYY